MPAIRVGIVEDHRLFLDLLAESLGKQDDITVVVKADCVTEAKKTFNPTELDVVILDIELPDGNGIGLGVTWRRQNPNLGIVLLSAGDVLELVESLPEHENRGWCYLSKSSTKSVEAVAGVIRAAARGEVVIDPSLTSDSRNAAPSRVAALTTRQRQILQAVADGDSNQTIADKLGIAPNSVGNHLISIYAALGIPEGKNARVTAVLELLADCSTSPYLLTRDTLG